MRSDLGGDDLQPATDVPAGAHLENPTRPRRHRFRPTQTECPILVDRLQAQFWPKGGPRGPVTSRRQRSSPSFQPLTAIPRETAWSHQLEWNQKRPKQTPAPTPGPFPNQSAAQGQHPGSAPGTPPSAQKYPRPTKLQDQTNQISRGKTQMRMRENEGQVHDSPATWLRRSSARPSLALIPLSPIHPRYNKSIPRYQVQ